MSWSKLRELAWTRRPERAAVHGISESPDIQLSDWTELKTISSSFLILLQSSFYSHNLTDIIYSAYSHALLTIFSDFVLLVSFCHSYHHLKIPSKNNYSSILCIFIPHLWNFYQLNLKLLRLSPLSYLLKYCFFFCNISFQSTTCVQLPQ